jgi:gliding motility-associated-like protein
MIPRHILCILITFFCLRPGISAQNITTIAGDGYMGNVGDNGPATCAGIPLPLGICLDGKGFLYLATSNTIRKIDLANNTIYRVAGSDTYGYAGDGGPAKDALLTTPGALCIDKKNNLYIAEFESNRIRKVNLSTGIISTVAGTGIAGFSGDGGPASLALLNKPRGICTDPADNLYIADAVNNRIRKIDAVTGIITTHAGNGSQGFSGDGGQAAIATVTLPTSVAADANGNIYLAEVSPMVTSRIRRINATTGIITTICGNNNYLHSGDGGPAINAELFNPVGLSFDPAGNLYIAQNDDSRIRMISASTGIITTIAGNGATGFGGDGGPALLGTMNNPRQIVHDGENLYISDLFNNRIRRVGPDAVPPTVLPTRVDITSTTEISCEGSPVTFTASAVNPGFNAIYRWKVNDNPVNVIQPTFTTSILKDGDRVNFTLLAIVCGQNLQINSDYIRMKVKPAKPLSVTINATDTVLCPGQGITFSATTINAGINLAYQWKINGINAGTNSSSFTSTSLNDKDTILCVARANSTDTCAEYYIATSNPVVVSVSAGLFPAINITASANDICKGIPVTFIATTNNTGTNPVYQWTINGNNTGTNNPSYSTNNINDNDVIVCRLKVSGSACPTAEVSSSKITMHVKPSPVITLSPIDTLVSPGTQVKLNARISGQYSGFNWSPSNLLSSPATLTPVTVSLNSNADFTLDVTGTEGCTATANSSIRIYRKLFMPNAFTPNGDNVNDVYRIPTSVSITLTEFSIFDRWGNRVFTTKDITQGWNGSLNGSKSPNGVYTYMIRGADDKGRIVEKGSFTLIR